ncbi:MAG TPA: hypothetical protein VF796_06505 [Humisphaera sp.]
MRSNPPVSSPRRPLRGEVRCAVETLEDRQLLSASLAPAGVAVTPGEAMVESAPLAGGYAGTMKYSKVDGVRPPSRTLVIDVASRSSTGALTGTLTAAGVGIVEFTGQLDGRHVNLQWDDQGTQGYVIAKTNKSGTKLSAKVLNVTTGTKAKVKAAAAEEVGRALYTTGQTVNGTTATALTTTTVVGGSMAGANPVVYSTGGTGNASYRARIGNPYQDAAGELHFVGVYNGSVTVRTATEVHGDNLPGPFSAAQTYSATMNITGETTSDLLTGTMVIGSLGSYNVTGVVKLDEVTLIVTPQASAANPGGTGVMKLHVSRDGFTYSGRFEQEENDVWAFGTATFTRPGNTGTTGTGTGTGAVASNGVGTGTGTGTSTGTGSNSGTGTGSGSGTGSGTGTGLGATGAIPHPELATSTPAGVATNGTGAGAAAAVSRPGTNSGTGAAGTTGSATGGTTTGTGTSTGGSTTGTGTTTGGVGTGTNIPPTSPFNPGTIPGTTPIDPVTVPSTTDGGPVGNTPGVDVAGNPTTSPGGSGSGSPGTDIANPTNPTSPTTGTSGLPADGTGTVGTSTANGQTLPTIVG